MTRRFIAAALVGAALLTSGCKGLPFTLGQPLPRPLGPVFELEDGLDVECREIDRQACLDAASGARRHPDFDPKVAIRIIVTCDGRCELRQGSAAMQMLASDGSLVDLGTVTYWAD